MKSIHSRRVMSLCVCCSLTFSSFISNCVSNSPVTNATSDETNEYFVELNDDPISTYKGGIEGYEITAPVAKKKINWQDTKVQKYNKYLEKKHDPLKKWIKNNSKKSKISAEFTTTLNGLAINATPDEVKQIKKVPGVKRVLKSKVYRPTMNKSVSLINLLPAWQSGYDGSGVKVAVIDSGIEQNHPFIKDDSLKMPTGFPKTDNFSSRLYTNSKVIVAKVFSDKTTATPKALGSHGTHVAGTIAGKSNFKDPAEALSTKMSGVAPKAYLGSYNVFPCKDGAGCTAPSTQIAKAIEAAVNDGMDVANLSLGGSADKGFDLLEEVVNAASTAGMTMVIAAGNEGPDENTIGTPGVAESAITVASVENAHFLGNTVNFTVDGESKNLAVGLGSPGGSLGKALQGDVFIVKKEQELGCGDLNENFKGKVVVLKRGTCTFSEKAKALQKKGAKGFVLINNEDGAPITMQLDSSVKIPSVMLSKKDGEWLTSGSSVKVLLKAGPMHEFDSETTGKVSEFSSRGPTPYFKLKPDVAAVGGNVYSSVLNGKMDDKSGTSMATPHVAGAAAILLQANPTWKPENVKAALIGTAGPTEQNAKPTEVGGGLIDVTRALKPVANAFPSSLSFGKLSSKRKYLKTLKVTLKNMNGKSSEVTLESDSEEVFFSKKSYTLKKDGSVRVDVAVLSKSKAPGTYQGYVKVKTDDDFIKIPYLYVVGK